MPKVTIGPASAATRPWRHAATKAGVSRTIGGKGQYDRVSVARLREGRTGCNRRTGVPAYRLQQDVRLDADLRKLLQHHEAIGRIGDDDRMIEEIRIRHPDKRVLKGRARPEQWQETALDGPRARRATAAFPRRRT